MVHRHIPKIVHAITNNFCFNGIPKKSIPHAKRPVPIEFRQKVEHLGVTGGAHDVGDCRVTLTKDS